VENEVEDGGEAREVVLSAGGESNRVVFVRRNNVVGIGRDGELPGGEFLLKRELVGDEFLLERVLELESLSIPDLHRFVVTERCELVDALHQASIGRVPKFDGSIVTSRAKEFAVGREREGHDQVGVALQRVRQDGISLVEVVEFDGMLPVASCLEAHCTNSISVILKHLHSRPLATLPRLRPNHHLPIPSTRSKVGA